jgi:hypothetical protein
VPYTEEGNARWRLERPGFPEPEVWARSATAGETPAAAARVTASTAWETELLYARGTWSDENGEPVQVVTREPLYDEGGNPVLTPKGQHACREVKTGEFVIVESVLLKARKGDQWIRGVWERRKGTEKWKFTGAWTHQRKISSAEMIRMLKS